MMSLISAARICMTVFPPTGALGVAGHLLAHSCQLRAKAAVPDPSAGVEDDTTEQLGIDVGAYHHVGGPDQALRELGQLRLLGRAERRRGANAHARSADLRVDERVVCPRDVTEQWQAVAVGQQPHQIDDRLGHPERRDHTLDDLATCGPLDGWIQHHGPEPGLVERRGGGAELLAGGHEISALARQLQERARIASGKAAGHDAGLAGSTNSRTKRRWSSGVTDSRTIAVAWRMASSTISLRTARSAEATSWSATSFASSRMRAAASRPCSRSFVRASWAVASRSALRRSCRAGSCRMSSSSCLWRSRACCCARLPAWSPSRKRSVRSRKYSRIGPARDRK